MFMCKKDYKSKQLFYTKHIKLVACFKSFLNLFFYDT